MKLFLIGDYEGPLDLLLHMIKESKMDINEIKIEVITKEYVEYIKEMQNMNLDVASEYLVMAAELIEMQSKSLLPKKESETDEYEEPAEEELKRRLLEYQKYKESTNIFKELEENRETFYTKAPERMSDFSNEKINAESDLTVYDLLDAFKKLLERKDYEKPIETKITKKELSITNRIAKIRSVLKLKKKVLFKDLFETMNKDYVVVTFLSILEMAKNNEINLKQEDNFGNIYLERI